MMVVVGRRDTRSNNSWMHNLPLLAKGPMRCTALVHPADAQRLGLRDGAVARISSHTSQGRRNRGLPPIPISDCGLTATARCAPSRLMPELETTSGAGSEQGSADPRYRPRG